MKSIAITSEECAYLIKVSELNKIAKSELLS